MQTTNVISISGGKDSTAMWLLALERETQNLQVVFADVGHEHPKTYEYIEYLEKHLGSVKRIKPDFTERIEKKRITVQTKWRDEGVSESVIDDALSVLKPTGIPMLDLALWKGRFPSTKARFCTQELKVRPMFEQIYEPVITSGDQMISWQGVRAQESSARAKLTKWEDTPEGFSIYRPLLDWDVYDVFKMHENYGIDPNPLYKEGMNRVGCMPCINSNKQEMYEIARRYPEEIDRLREWEALVSKANKHGSATFFTSDYRGHGVDEIVEWSKTARGGTGYDLTKLLEPVPLCSSQYGLCE